MSNQNRDDRRRVIAKFADRLRPGERAMQYCSDVAGCECETHRFSGIPCTVIGTTAVQDRGNHVGVGTDRCLVCGVAWRHRVRKCDPLVYVKASDATRNEEAAA